MSDKCEDCLLGFEYDYDHGLEEIREQFYKKSLFKDMLENIGTDFKFNFCPFCGTQIDWSKLDEKNQSK